MKGRQVRYSAEELAWLEARADWPRVTLHQVFVMLFDRRELKLDHIKSLCWRKGWSSGRTGCFEKGHVPPNKGRKGYCPPGCEKGWFKPGVRRGVAEKLYKPIGTERLSKEGYLERKINDDLPLQGRWRGVHLVRWEAVNGPIPDQHCLKCLDGDRLNTDPSNWHLIHRAVLARLNGGPRRRHLPYNEASPEVRPTLIALAQVAHQGRKRRRAGGRS